MIMKFEAVAMHATIVYIENWRNTALKQESTSEEY